MRPVSLDRPLAPEPGVEGEALVEHLGDRPGLSQMHVSRLMRRSLVQLSEMAQAAAA